MSFKWVAQTITGLEFDSTRHAFGIVPVDQLARFILSGPKREVALNLLTGEFAIDGQHVGHDELNNIRLRQGGRFTLLYSKNAAMDYNALTGEVHNDGLQSAWIGWKGEQDFIMWEIYPTSDRVRLLTNEAAKCPL